jgi:hypothetical protein
MGVADLGTENDDGAREVDYDQDCSQASSEVPEPPSLIVTTELECDPSGAKVVWKKLEILTGSECLMACWTY